MTPDFEKVSVLRNADVTYSSVSIPMLRASLKPEVVGWQNKAGHYSATSETGYKHGLVRLLDYRIDTDRLLGELGDERKLRRDHASRIHQLVDALTSINNELLTARIKIDDLQSDVELVTAHGADLQSELDTLKADFAHQLARSNDFASKWSGAEARCGALQGEVERLKEVSHSFVDEVHGKDLVLNKAFDLLKYAYNHSEHLPNEQDVDRFLTAHGR